MLKSLNSAAYQHFLTELRAAREAAGLTQDELAGRLGEHQTLVSKVERGVRRLDIVELRAWLMALDVQLTEFVGRFDDRLQRHGAPRVARSRARR